MCDAAFEANIQRLVIVAFCTLKNREKEGFLPLDAVCTTKFARMDENP